MESDRELLRQYAQEGREAAFAEVVRRHMDLVYSAALRLVAGDSALAQDVTQEVFTTLARKAAALSTRENLLGWLHTTTRYAASVAVRGERRRRTHEQEAGTTMHDQPATTAMDWMQLQPALDDAVGSLRAVDREAVLLRFFQGKSHREVGAELGLNEALARKRIDRALEKLRVYLSRRGVTVSSAVLAGAMTANSVQAAPAGLAGKLGVVAVAQAGKVGVFAGILNGITMHTKTKTGVTAIVLLALAAVPMALHSHQLAKMDELSADLARRNAILSAQVDQLQAKSKGQNLTWVVSTKDSGLIPVELAAIKNLSFSIADANFTLSKEAIGLLGLSPDEASQVQKILTQLRDQVQNNLRASVKEIAPKDVADSTTRRFLDSNSGKQSVYQLPAMSDDALASLQKWFSDNIAGVIGPDRADVFVSKAAESRDFWLQPGEHGTIAFSDYLELDGKTMGTAWNVQLVSSKVGNFNSGTRGSKGAIPTQWSFLFKESNSPAQVAQGMPPPQIRAIQDNLRTIGAMAQTYMGEKGVKQVTYDELTSGPDPFVKPVTPVSGEDYREIVVHQNDTTISINAPGLGIISFSL